MGPSGASAKQDIMQHDLQYYVQQCSVILAIVILAGVYSVISVLVVKGSRTTLPPILVVWAALTVLSLIALYVSALIFFGSRKVTDVSSVRVHGEEVASCYRRENKRAALCGGFLVVLLAGWYIISRLGFESILVYDLFRLGTLVNLTIIYWALYRIHASWYWYFGTAKRLGVEQKRAEFYYKEASQHILRRVHRTLVECTYHNYCAVVGGVCSKVIQYQGPQSYFFAYPFVSKYTRRIKNIKEELEARRSVGVLPTGNDFAEVLVCKLCKDILSTQFFVAEVSIPNRNVFFEYGLAEGFGKKSWLLALGHIQDNKALNHPLLKDRIQIRGRSFSSRSVASRIQRDSILHGSRNSVLPERKVDIEEVSKRFENNLRTAVILGPHMVEFELGNLYYEYESMVDIIRDHLNRQGVQIIENSPNRAGHNVAKIYELIDPAQVAVGILADDEVSDYESINSVISYLIGYAMAKGNKILVFQRLPCKKSMLDLYGLTRFVKGADDLNLVFSKLMPNLITDKIPRSYLGPLD